MELNQAYVAMGSHYSGVSQTLLAGMLGISQQQVSRIAKQLKTDGTQLLVDLAYREFTESCKGEGTSCPDEIEFSLAGTFRVPVEEILGIEEKINRERPKITSLN